MIVVDTHSLIWWINGRWDELSRSARIALDDTDRVGVPVIVCWEIVMLVQRNRVSIHGDVRDWLEDVMALSSVTLLPLSVAIATRAATLDRLLRDPVDCLVTATALHHGAPLVTKDARIRASGLVETIW